MTQKDEKTGIPTTGHSWDGIRELDNPMPRWWLWIFYITIVWGIGYTIAYPAWPLISSATRGVLDYSTRAEVATEIARVEDSNSALETRLASVDLTTISEDAALENYARQAGRSVFLNNCSQCHGSGAAGAVGFPNLLDDAWLWGGDIDAIAFSVRHGVRNEQSLDARWSEMPAFGRDELLTEPEIASVVQYVLQLSGQDHDAASAADGALIYSDNCAACHGDTGKGDTDIGAPDLSDAIWLYAGDEASITESIVNSRFGVMPAWSEEFRPAGGLSDAEVNAVAAYVHQLGGGE